jgi:hypothetical protein
MHLATQDAHSLNCTVKLGYNELGYNELPLIVNLFKLLVWFSIFCVPVLSVIANKIPVITNKNFEIKPKFNILAVWLFGSTQLLIKLE